MAYADGRLFVPVADACNRGQLVALAAASGRVLWRRRLAAPDLGCAAVANDVVFTSSDDGTVDGFDTRSGAQLWRARLPTRNGTCPAVAGETLFVGAGISLVAYSLAR
jgi:alcohol dehydrogenase (cytochrome c)